MIRRLSLKKKLQAVIMLTVAAALLLACSALMTYDVASARSAMRSEAEILAGMVVENCTAALTFEDIGSANQLLRGLNAQPAVSRPRSTRLPEVSLPPSAGAARRKPRSRPRKKGASSGTAGWS